MENVLEALKKPAIRAIPEDGLALLNDRTLFVVQLINGKSKLPSRGSFTHVIGAVSTGVTLTVDGDHITLKGRANRELTLTPTTVDVFVAEIKANEYSLMQIAPIYLTFLHLVGADFDFYVRVSGGRAAKQLIEQPQQLPVHDVLGLKAIDTGETEMDLAQAIDHYGYEKLVAGTEVEFLGQDNIAEGYHLASVTPH
ncbi:hypothetical protein [Lacticaseibacillus porcinae]|uniref:hypothetical protein n=1 Tax=Lacticaseibacillus porcinae TaxID=1123687 RepID=UPI000F78D86D|nr:hypothetical protein [Lacticaseibacillus porcinae]